ncbi:MAG TPA: glycine--tRNA ligase subunit beta, partial [Gammaproteobacteria bacterium]|nr:glycine--tRNA ligase subunit beta [Gammaproteobacteria bacterium]
GDVTYGHRIHHPEAITIALPNIYEDKLEQEGCVIANFAKRQQLIKQGIIDLAQKEHAEPVIDQALLDLVTGLVEFPIALLATFAADFLRVPKECLISAMQDHQKCFALLDTQGNLLPKFILISNIESIDPKAVIHGNELVMTARLADAAFHYDNDQKSTLESRVAKLKTIVYQKQLGSLYDKVTRIEQLSSYLAPLLSADQKHVQRAAHLCKADLLTNMVYEFPELQGIMGYYYALHDKEPKDVAIAIQEHYKPRTASDDLPDSKCGIAVAIADRVDTLVGFFGIGNVPTGEKDPFALRRQALAIVRILIEKNINLDLRALMQTAVKNYAGKIKDSTDELMQFCFERLKAWYLANGVQARTFDAVLFSNPNNPLDFNKRIYAVTAFQKLPAAASLAAANKRVQNILEKNSSNAQRTEINAQLISSPEEKQLLNDITSKEVEIAPLMQQADYTSVLQSLASLQAPVDNFFDKVMVMVDDEKVRNNRLNLLHRLRNLFIQVADISLL